MRRDLDLVASELRSELVDHLKDARIVTAIGTKQHVQIADTLGAPQVIEAVPEEFGPAPARNDQYVAVLIERICHGASVLRSATRRCAVRRLCRLGRWQLDIRNRRHAWCWSRHGLDWSFGT